MNDSRLSLYETALQEIIYELEMCPSGSVSDARREALRLARRALMGAPLGGHTKEPRTGGYGPSGALLEPLPPEGTANPRRVRWSRRKKP